MHLKMLLSQNAMVISEVPSTAGTALSEQQLGSALLRVFWEASAGGKPAEACCHLNGVTLRLVGRADPTRL